MTTQQPQQSISQKEVVAAVNLLTLLNKFNLKIFSAKTKKALIFLILNDTIQLIRYDRATLWKFEDGTPQLLGVSGQSTFSPTSDLANKWSDLVKDMVDPSKPQVFSQDSFSKEKRLWIDFAAAPPKPSVLWIPIFSDNKLQLGFWLERWNAVSWTNQEAEIVTFITQAFGIAWEKFQPKYSWRILKQKRVILTSLAVVLLLLSLRISMRIVAPCEVVPKDPILITAPLEDIIAEIDVKPGQTVKKDDILFQYDKRVVLENLKAAQEQVHVAELDLSRAQTLAFKDEKAFAEISVLAAKLKKEQVSLALAEYRASLLNVKAPEAGTVMLDDPDAWRGKPVRVGEKVLMISHPNKTKLRIWIPESDNVVLDPAKHISVILNINPSKTWEAKLIYIANTSTINDKHVPSFVAEADWIEEPHDVKMGVKGTAILYGQNVSVFYWLMRKPITYLRNLTGF